MKTPILSATAVALLALTACQSKTETNVTNSTTENSTTVSATPIELPPAIKAEVTFRCHGDNSLVKVTFFEPSKSGAVTASIQSPPEASPVALSAPDAASPMTADGGWSLTGTPTSIKLTQPGKPEQSCDK